jgi:hypothetical protein
MASSSSVVDDSDSDSTPCQSKAPSTKTVIPGPSQSGVEAADIATTREEFIRAQFMNRKRTPASPAHLKLVEQDIRRITAEEYLRKQEEEKRQAALKDGSAQSELDNIEIHDAYANFYNIPPPDLDSHPSRQPNPFTSTSSAPRFSTTDTSVEARRYFATLFVDKNRLKLAEERRKKMPDENLRTVPYEDSKKRYETPKKKLLPFSRTENEDEQTTIYQALAEGSPEARPSPSKTPQTPGSSRRLKSAVSDLRVNIHNTTPVTDDFDKKSGGLRSLSNFFKPRTSSDRSTTASNPSISSPTDHGTLHPAATPELRSYDLVRLARKILDCH